MAEAIGFHGRPTRPDVDRLDEHFKDLERDGRIIRHEEIEQVIGESRGTARYKTVIDAWRKKLDQDRGIYLDGRRAVGEGFVVMKAPEMVDFSRREVRSAGRKIGRAVRVVSSAPDSELDVVWRMKRDHVARNLAFLSETVQGVRRAVTARMPEKPASLPVRKV